MMGGRRGARVSFPELIETLCLPYTKKTGADIFGSHHEAYVRLSEIKIIIPIYIRRIVQALNEMPEVFKTSESVY